MGVVTRLVDVINANVNAALDKAEQPEKMIRLVIQELEETLVDVRSHAAKCIAEKKSLSRTNQQLESDVQTWLSKAETALTKGREDLAKQALVEKSKSESALSSLNTEIETLDKQLTAITEDIAKLQVKLSEAKAKQSELVKREKLGSTRLKAKKVYQSSNLEVLDQQYERVVRKIDQVESECEAYDLASKNDSLKAQFEQLEADEQIEKEMAELKQKVANA